MKRSTDGGAMRLRCGCNRRASQCENDINHCCQAKYLWQAYCSAMLAVGLEPAVEPARRILHDAYYRHIDRPVHPAWGSET